MTTRDWRGSSASSPSLARPYPTSRSPTRAKQDQAKAAHKRAEQARRKARDELALQETLAIRRLLDPLTPPDEVAVPGIWRSTGTGLRLSPAEADSIGEHVDDAAGVLAASLAGDFVDDVPASR